MILNGTGGKNTNVSGLSFEDKMYLIKYLKDYYDIDNINKNYAKLYDKGQLIGLYLRKREVYKYLNDNNVVNQFNQHREPDSLIVNLLTKTVTIIEMKNQTTHGSVTDKLLDGPYFVYYWKTLFSKLGYDVKMTYILSEYYEENAKDQLNYLTMNNIKYKIIKENDDKISKDLLM